MKKIAICINSKSWNSERKRACSFCRVATREDEVKSWNSERKRACSFCRVATREDEVNSLEKKSLGVERGHVFISVGYSEGNSDGSMSIHGSVLPFFVREDIELQTGDSMSVCIEPTDELIFEGVSAKKDFGRILEQYKDLEKILIDKGVINDEGNSSDH